MIFASPVAGSSSMTLLASWFANRSLPSSPAIGPSALLPSQAHTTFQLWFAAMTPGIAAGVGSAGGGGATAVDESPSPLMRKGCGFFEQVSSTAARAGFCHDCWLLPRSNADDGL